MVDAVATIIDPAAFIDTIQGKSTALYILENTNGMRIAITNYGARVVALYAIDRDGKIEDVVLGFPSLAGYRSELDQAFGAIVGRYANRIKNGQFDLNGEDYQLDRNDGPNTLHSGSASWMNRVWDVVSSSDGHLTLGLGSPDGEGGFPGTVHASVTYTLDENNTLRIAFNAEASSPTVVNMTNHTYFNLGGECSGDIMDHHVQVNAEAVTAVDDGLIPTGRVLQVEGTALDLRNPVSLEERLVPLANDLAVTNGFDHNYIVDRSKLDPSGLAFVAAVMHNRTGRRVEVWTTQPGMQLYTGNWINEKIEGKCGERYVKRQGMCLETQHFPDSPNHPEFPSTVVDEKNPYHEVVEYRFSVD